MRVLHIEDDAGEARLLEETLRGLALSARWEGARASTLAEGLRLAKRGGFDAILLDLGLPDSQGLESLRAVRKVNPDVPVVVLTGLEDDETALQALRDGAQDYLVKGRITGPVLVRVLNHSIARAAIQFRLGDQRRRSAPRTPGAWSRVRLVHVHPAEHDAAISRHVGSIGDAGGMVVFACFGAPADKVRERLHKAGVKTSAIHFVDAAQGALAPGGKPNLDDIALAIESSCDQLGIRSQVVLDSLNHVMERTNARTTVHFMQVVGNRMRALGINLDLVVVDDAAGRALASSSGGAVDTVMTARAPLRGLAR